jgi:anti-anti-sigma regulatory factor
LISITETSPATISIDGQIGLTDVDESKRLLAEKIINCDQKELSIDVSGLTSVSSVVLSILLSGLRASQSISCKTRYINLPVDLYNMARVGGIETILTNYET